MQKLNEIIHILPSIFGKAAKRPVTSVLLYHEKNASGEISVNDFLNGKGRTPSGIRPFPLGNGEREKKKISFLCGYHNTSC
jgi:hypothetical protein